MGRSISIGSVASPTSLGPFGVGVAAVSTIVLLPQVMEGGRCKCVLVNLLDAEMVLVRSESLLLLYCSLLFDTGESW